MLSGSMANPLHADRIRRLLDVGATLVAELEPVGVLDRILEEARGVTGARYAAIGVLDAQRGELERFLTAGVDAATRRAIGDLPHGRGVLGVLIEDPRPLRLADVGSHPESYGFPPGHPAMHSFLGVPIEIRGEAWGNLYLTEKQGDDEFSQADEEAALILARFAAVAIENARLYDDSERRREQLERAVRSLEASGIIADAISNVTELERVLELIVQRGQALIDAQSVLIMLREGDELVLAASAGHTSAARRQRLPIAGSTSGQVLERGRPERITEVTGHMRIAPDELGVLNAHSALIVPMLNHGTRVGVLAAFDRGKDGEAFTAADEQLMRVFAASAANAVAIGRSVKTERLRSAIAAADDERRRWARELHDQTLQALGGLRVLLASTHGRGDAAAKDDAIRQAMEDIELEIDNLRGIINDLRPSLLDDVGLLPAIEALLERHGTSGLEIATDLALPDPKRGGAGLDPELETTIYRLVQEALTNVVKHAQASAVNVSIGLSGDHIIVEVQDDGVGFDVGGRTAGFGLAGMRERVYLVGGTLEIESGDWGTHARARLPIVQAGEHGTGSAADQVAS
jgi:signal transduction histidine kinase